jgi:RimJ/RimL family protein N-acetyltransferase
MKISSLETRSLQLVRHSSRQILALIEQPAAYAELTGFPAAPGLREFYVGAEVSPEFLEMLRAGEKEDPWAVGFAVVHKAARLVIGSAGFKGPPDGEGRVEIAYGIVPSYEGRGYATEAARALIEFALQDPAVRHVHAHTLPARNASTRVLAKCGFAFRGEVIDPQDGLIWKWQLENKAKFEE